MLAGGALGCPYGKGRHTQPIEERKLSGIAAVIRFDGGEVDPGTVETLTREMAYRGPDGIAHWSRGPVALGHCMLHTTAESFEAAMPLANEDESLVLVLAGWLSNYDEMRSDLLSRGAILRNRSDAELVLRAYEAWGDDCPRHLEGEFAFVIWDARRGEAFCARDHAGLQPLHYYWDGKRLIVASDQGAILALPGVPRQENRGMIAEIMANEWITRGETVWEGIMRLLPATWMRFGRNGLRTGTYWAPPQEVTIRYKRDEDYQAHYREVFAESVRRASRSHLPIACDVSGGLDSSAVFAMAHDLQRKGRLPSPGVKGYTYRFEEGSAPDELAYARAVAAHVSAEVREIEPFLPTLEWFAERGRLDRDMAPYPNATMAHSIGQALTGDGCRVSLNGEGGDEWLSGKPFYYSEQLAARDFSAVASALREDCAAIGLRSTLYRLLRFGFAPLTPRPILELRRKLMRQRGPNNYARAFWLAPELEQILTQRRDAADPSGFRSIRNFARRSMFMQLKDPFIELARDQYGRQRAREGCEPRTPMYARQFIEFAFSTPERIKLCGDTHKYVHVSALADLLPAKVLQRKTKAEFSLAFERQIDRIYGDSDGSAPLEGDRYLDRTGVERLFQNYLKLPLGYRPIWELWGIFACGRLLLPGSSYTS